MRPFFVRARLTPREPSLWRRGVQPLVTVAPTLLRGAVLSWVVATGVWGSYHAGRWALRLAPLQVHGIEVRGLERTPREALLASAGLGLHQPLLAVDLRQSVAAMEALPWVRQAKVRRQLPDRLRIEVEEHVGKVAAMVGELWLVNPDGEPFKRFRAADGLVLPVVTGIRAQPASERPLHRQAGVTERLRQALQLLDAMVEVRDDLFNVDELHWDADLGWSSVVLLGRAYARPGAPRPTTLVHLGREPQARLAVLTHVLGQLADRHQVPAVIWASHVHQEGRVQVQLAPATAVDAPPPLPAGFVAKGRARARARPRSPMPAPAHARDQPLGGTPL